MGKLKRAGVSSVNSPESLPDTLRSLGNYVDRENGRLLRIDNYELSGPETAYRVEFALADGSRGGEPLCQSRPLIRSLTRYARKGNEHDGDVLSVRR